MSAFMRESGWRLTRFFLAFMVGSVCSQAQVQQARDTSGKRMRDLDESQPEPLLIVNNYSYEGESRSSFSNDSYREILVSPLGWSHDTGWAGFVSLGDMSTKAAGLGPIEEKEWEKFFNFVLNDLTGYDDRMLDLHEPPDGLTYTSRQNPFNGMANGEGVVFSFAGIDDSELAKMVQKGHFCQLWSPVICENDVKRTLVKLSYERGGYDDSLTYATVGDLGSVLESSGFSLKSAESVELTIPAGSKHSDTYRLQPEPVFGKSRVDVLVPVEVVELSPKVKDEQGNDIVRSENPSAGRPLTPFVELNPVADKIAHRELKVRIGEVLKGKTVTWTLEPVPGATPATIRGAWTNSTTHSNRFEASATYGANGFTSLSQASGRTIVANDGFTAVRVNVPPVGYNKVRIRIEIEGVATVINLIDMEVPAIVVIDPGHGGDPSGPKVGGSDPEHALCPKPPAGSGSSERVMTLEFGSLLRDRLLTLRTRDHLNLRFCMTRTADVNSSLAARANIARDRGADVFISFHFNDNVPNTGPRGTETYYDSTGNFNQAEDEGLAGRVNAAVFGAISASDAAARNRGVKGQGLDVLSDQSLGNNENYHPIRAVLLETEFIDVLAVDQLLNTNGNHQQVRQTIIDALGDALQDDLLHNPQ